MKLQEVLKRTTEHFQQKGMSSPRLDAELLLAAALKIRRLDLYLQFDRPLNEGELGFCRDLVRRRSLGEPVAYILGVRDFFESTFEVGPGVLIPRPETEHVVERALELLQGQERPKILDLGSGSGCIIISLLLKFSHATGVAIENSSEARSYLLRNCEKFNLASRLEVLDVAAESYAQGAEFDLVVANPPYIADQDTSVESNVKKFEPSVALFSGPNGLESIESWAQTAGRVLKLGGWLVMEIGHNQGSKARDIFVKSGFSAVKVTQDLAGLDRVVSGQKSV